MKQQPFYRTLSLALACWLCAGSLLHARDYADLYARHGKQRHGETHARMTADLLIMGRSNSMPSVTILTSEPDGGPTTSLLNASNLELDASISGRYDLILTDDSDYELQFTLTGFPNGHSAHASRSDDDIRATFFGRSFTSAPVGEPANTSGTYAVNYDSQFGSGEINLRHRLGSRVTWFSGLRYIALQEDIDFVASANSEGSVRTSPHVDNALYGLQIGIESTAWTNGKARFDVIGRGGVFLNHMEAKLQTVADSGGSTVYTDHKKQSDIAAFAADLQAVLVVPLGPGSLRLGYQAFYVNKAALLPNQFDSLDFSDAATSVGSFEFSSPVYHGGFLGLEVPF